MSEQECDVLVMGGGPAGSTAAAVLAQHGRRVVLLEKEPFPRYHIGESLMPYCYFTLERIGVIDQIRESHFPKKYSVQFVRQNGEISTPFYFFQHYDHPSSTTWQVVRSEFDRMMLENAQRLGVEVRQGVRAEALLREGERVTGARTVDAEGRRTEIRAPITIDATGRDALSIARNRWRVPDERLKKIAIWTYYRGAMRDEGLDEGATTVAYLPEKGWFWYIPLPDNLVSVGVVADREYLYTGSRDERTILEREAGNNEWIRCHLAPGEPIGEYWTTSEFSYRSRYCAADGLVLVGDAFAFLDPVFSSGVFLALRSGEMAADAVHAALAAGDVSAGRFEEYGRNLCEQIEAMRKIVYAFYDEKFSFGEFFRKYPEIRPDLTDCLIGHLQRDFDLLFDRMAEFAELPEPLPHGEPLKKEAEPALAAAG